ncbi:hypothetical protein [Geodermatophilus sp. YIM 151500]|uniref:hypothetical protein n=1 Tax=Geodermatophilus sp. YIM 151500 TaxID=2984531 RepID=UPI0021E36574|nr:hypothetical protein [Geodermatophilus sp. YIM 151500]
MSVHTTWLAAAAFAVPGLAGDGPAGWRRLGADDLLATAYLAVAVSAVAFVLWYSAVRRSAPGGPAADRLGVAVVVAGLALGLCRDRSAAVRRPV